QAARLYSACARPFQTAFGEEIYPGGLQVAALFHSIIQDHPFMDGNKRTHASPLFTTLGLWDTSQVPHRVFRCACWASWRLRLHRRICLLTRYSAGWSVYSRLSLSVVTHPASRYDGPLPHKS
ncbi:MAG TPA: Fic family protein, partial [Dehalococcoidia bacterium]|nr:Fic family protein [Dehalococcoidia bacterium]